MLNREEQISFFQNLFSTFLGAVLGFIFSIILFHIVEDKKEKKTKKTLIRSLKKEFEFNIYLLKKLKDDISKIIEKVNGDNHEIYIYLKYNEFQTFFLQRYFQLGYMYDNFSPEDISIINNLLNRYNLTMTNLINQKISQWNQKELNKAKLNNELTTEKDFIEEDIKNLESLYGKIKEEKQ